MIKCIEITKEPYRGDYDLIRYHVKDARRDCSGLGTLARRCLDGPEFTEVLPRLGGLESSDAFAQIVDFFPNGVLSYLHQPTKKEEKRMRQGAGSALLEEMMQDAEHMFFAKAIGAFRCSASFARFLEKKGFSTIYGGAYYKLL